MWDSDVKTWATWLDRYTSTIEARASLPRKSDLVSLDSFVWSQLASSVVKRGHLTREEYSRLVKWKLQRGKWRPRLQGFADMTKEADVAKASKTAIEKLSSGNLKDALKPLVDLKGCGPATASAFLAVVDSNVPFMSDELMAHTHGRDNKKYTVAVFLEMVEQATSKAAELTNQSADHTWTARDVERAVFAAEYCKDPTPITGRTKPGQEPKTDRKLAKRPAVISVPQSNSVSPVKRTSKNESVTAVSRKRARNSASLTRSSDFDQKVTDETTAEDAEAEQLPRVADDLDSQTNNEKTRKLSRKEGASLRRSKRRRGT